MDYFQLLLIFSFLLEIFCNNFEIRNNVLFNDTPVKTLNELTMMQCAFSCNQINSTYANSNVNDKAVMGRGKCHCFEYFNESLVEDNKDWHLLFPLVLQPLPDFSEATRILDASKKYCFTADPHKTHNIFKPLKLEPIDSPVCNSTKSWFVYREFNKKIMIHANLNVMWLCKKIGQITRMVADNKCATKFNEFEFTPWNTLMFMQSCYYPVDAVVSQHTEYEHSKYGANVCLKNENRIYFDNYTCPDTVAVDFYLMDFQPYDLNQLESIVQGNSAANSSGYQAEFKFDIYVDAKFQVRLRTYFVPPKDGEYFFTMCCGYKCRLYIGNNPGKEGANQLQLVLENSDVLLSKDCHGANWIESSGFTLEFGRPYYMEAWLLGNSVDSYIRVGANTKPNPRFASWPSIRHYYLKNIGN